MRLLTTLRMCMEVFMARTFGHYMGSGWNGEFHYHSYAWHHHIVVMPDMGWFKTKLRVGVRGKKQLPLFMIWREYWEYGEVVDAEVIFNSQNWIGV